MNKYLKFDLAPFPLSLFTKNGFRKNFKSQMFSHFTETEILPITSNLVHVIDGGYLLHKVVWQKNDSIEIITEKFLAYVRHNYAENSCIVLDEYTDEESDNCTASSTKTMERSRRKGTSSMPSFHTDK